MTVRSRLQGLAATIALIVAIIGFPAALLAIDALPSTSDLSWARLNSPDDGTIAVSLVTVAAWLAWLIFTSAVVIELAARARGVRTPSIPGLRAPQVTAGRLVALASLLFVATPALAPAVALPRAAAEVAADPSPIEVVAPRVLVHPDAESPREDSPTTKVAAPPTTNYTVRRGDSLWKIATERLGAGRRFTEIVDLNADLLQGQPDFIAPGTVLRIPRVAVSEVEDEYVVQTGDTLSGIAHDLLGDEERYKAIFEASDTIRQPDGRRLVDPDEIRPGWRLEIPGTARDQGNAENRGDQARPFEPPVPHRSPPPPVPPPAPSASQDPAASGAADEEVEAVSEADTVNPSWLVPGLIGAGGFLAGSMLLVLRQHRRTQARYRLPGQVIAPPPERLRAVEKSAHLAGTVTAPQIDALDRALRSLESGVPERPNLRVVRLAQDRIQLDFAETVSSMPRPWSGSGSRWSAPIDGSFEVDSETLAPYPMLVSVGRTPGGDLVLVDLEAARTLHLTGPPARVADLVRHLAAELALNPWAQLVEVDALGIGDELAGLEHIRIRRHDHADRALADRLISEVSSTPESDDPDRYRALLLGPDASPSHASTLRIIASRTDRSGVAAVLTGEESSSGHTQLRISPDGIVSGDPLPEHTAAAGLSPSEAEACAAIVDLTRDAASVPPPPSSSNTDLDSGGAIRTDVPSARPTTAAGEASLLPRATEDYVEAAATTYDDCERLAPVISPVVRKRVMASDPTLDDDLARWADDGALVPRLRLLGPVEATAHGNPRAVAKRKPFYIELLAYLVLHPEGASSSEIADAFGLTTPRTRVDVGVVRSWLGEHPVTHQLYLPTAESTRSTSNYGAKRYLVNGVLSDLDLFRRLRARGQAKGAEGIPDLHEALRLVSGEPFSHLRPAGWSWLLDGDRIDHIMACAVADVSHIITNSALTDGDLATARWSAEAGHRAAPSDEICRLDLAQVAAASGHFDIADQMLDREILNRSDDALGPVELPTRTDQILRSARRS